MCVLQWSHYGGKFCIGSMSLHLAVDLLSSHSTSADELTCCIITTLFAVAGGRESRRGDGGRYVTNKSCNIVVVCIASPGILGDASLFIWPV
jgi:hypothetical protein